MPLLIINTIIYSMRHNPSLPSSADTSVFGFGLKVSKEPLLPRIFSHQQIKNKKVQSSLPTIHNQSSKTTCPTLTPIPSQDISTDQSSNRLVLILKNGKGENSSKIIRRKTEMSRKELQQYGQIAQKFQERVLKESQKHSSSVCLEFPNRIHKLEKLSRIHRVPKRNISDKHYQQVRRHNMLIQKNLEHINPRAFDINSKKYQERIIETEKMLCTPPKRREITIDRVNKVKMHARTITLENRNQDTIDGYQVERENDDYELSAYMEREKSESKLPCIQDPENLLGVKKLSRTNREQ